MQSEPAYVPFNEFAKYRDAYNDAQLLLSQTMETSQQLETALEEAVNYTDQLKSKHQSELETVKIKLVGEITRLNKEVQNYKSKLEISENDKQKVIEESMSNLEQLEDLQNDFKIYQTEMDKKIKENEEILKNTSR